MIIVFLVTFDKTTADIRHIKYTLNNYRCIIILSNALLNKSKNKYSKINIRQLLTNSSPKFNFIYCKMFNSVLNKAMTQV